MTFISPPFPDEDSPDLADEDIAKAIPITSYSDVTRYPCPTCGNVNPVREKHARKRRKPNNYSKVTIHYECGHDSSNLYLFTTV